MSDKDKLIPDPKNWYRFKKAEVLESEKDKRYFWLMMTWHRRDESGQLVVEPRGYCYGKN